MGQVMVKALLFQDLEFNPSPDLYVLPLYKTIYQHLLQTIPLKMRNSTDGSTSDSGVCHRVLRSPVKLDDFSPQTINPFHVLYNTEPTPLPLIHIVDLLPTWIISRIHSWNYNVHLLIASTFSFH